MNKVVQITKVFKTDIDTLFELWTKPEHLRAWHRPNESDYTTPEAEVDLRVGGIFKVVMAEKGGSRHAMVGKILECTAPTSLTIQWQWEGSAEISQVHVRLRSVPDGTELTLTHEHPDESTSAEAHRAGWQGCLGVLEKVITKEV